MFLIPDNYLNGGKLLDGMFSTRNLVEACIVLLITGYGGISLLEIADGRIKAVIIILVALPLTIFALVGIGGDSLTQRLWLIFKHLRRKRKMSYQRPRYARAAASERR